MASSVLAAPLDFELALILLSGDMSSWASQEYVLDKSDHRLLKIYQYGCCHPFGTIASCANK